MLRYVFQPQGHSHQAGISVCSAPRSRCRCPTLIRLRHLLPSREKAKEPRTLTNWRPAWSRTVCVGLLPLWEKVPEGRIRGDPRYAACFSGAFPAKAEVSVCSASRSHSLCPTLIRLSPPSPIKGEGHGAENVYHLAASLEPNRVCRPYPHVGEGARRADEGGSRYAACVSLRGIPRESGNLCFAAPRAPAAAAPPSSGFATFSHQGRRLRSRGRLPTGGQPGAEPCVSAFSPCGRRCPKDG